MADDGILLNFSVPDQLFAPKTVYRGGSWRTRTRVQKHDQLRSQGIEPSSTKPLSGSNSLEVDISEERLAKRQKLGSGHASKSSRSTAYTSNTSGSHHEERSNGPKQIVSSLFTSNPASKTTIDVESEKQSANPVEPSNAPLTKEQLNFTTLGLTPAVAAHLTNRLSISAPTAIQKSAIPPLLKDDTDAFIQAETGSGKTLAYLLPIVQRIMQFSAETHDKENGVQRNSGLFAIILAPTRELSKQIFAVLEVLLRCANWIVAGQVMGGEKKKSEKARLRKGLNILVATPGRLADHIQHTEALDVSSVRWLVLDEGDRLMELGFEEDIKRIVSRLDFRMKNAKGKVHENLPKKRINILCSATMKMDVQRLGEISLNDAIHVTADAEELDDDTEDEISSSLQKQFSVPAQLKQSYVVVPAKLRLVTLVATLKKAFAKCAPTTKIIVFMSCADSVDFHFKVMTRSDKTSKEDSDSDSDDPVDESEGKKRPDTPNQIKVTVRLPRRQQEKAKKESLSVDSGTMAPSEILSSSTNNVTALRLHGSLPQPVRTSTLKSFSESINPALLICTDIASRGLDLPNVDRVIEFDPAFSREEHLHRVGRTARAGKDGAASIFLMPGCEEAYVEVLKSERADLSIGGLRRLPADEVLKQGFTGAATASEFTEPSKGSKKRGAPDQLSASEQLATEYQLDVERWVLENAPILEAGRRAFQSHVRAYATHVKEERIWFDIKELHLGHLAKAFGLRDRPSNVHVPGMRATSGKVKTDRKRAGGGAGAAKREDGNVIDETAEVDLNEARKQMKRKAQNTAGASEFNLA
jgi:ATP-dependent RNA helicase DDX31/DBP7